MLKEVYELKQDREYKIITMNTPQELRVGLEALTHIEDELDLHDKVIEYCIVAGSLHFFVDDINLIDDVIAEFQRGHDDNGWVWRSLSSIMSKVTITEEELMECFNDTNFFECSDNGRVWMCKTLST